MLEGSESSPSTDKYYEIFTQDLENWEINMKLLPKPQSSTNNANQEGPQGASAATTKYELYFIQKDLTTMISPPPPRKLLGPYLEPEDEEEKNPSHEEQGLHSFNVLRAAKVSLRN